MFDRTRHRRRGRLRAALLAAGLGSLLLAPSALAADTQIDVGTTDPTNDSTPTFTFSSPDDPTATFECRVDGTDVDFLPCTSPHTTGALTDAEHTFLVRAIDSTTTDPDPTPASQTFTVDTTAPQTTIDTGPSGPTNDTTPTFTFSSNEDPGATFECRVDADPFAPCSGSGTHTTAVLSQGPHTFEVRATDTAGNTDASPATRNFTVDTTAPQTTIDTGPSGPTNDTTPTFTFSSNEDPGATFECRVDGTPADFAPCTSPHTTAALEDGPHTFYVRATDAANNTGSAKTEDFNVDTTGPATTIDSGPSGLTNDNRPTFEFSSDPNATSECRVDADPFAPCSGPGNAHTPTADLPDGPHTFEVRATDALSNTGPPASQPFTVDATDPETTIDAGPTGTTDDDTPTFAFSATDESAVSFECRIDADPFAPCSGPGDTHTTEALDDGPHTFRVRATDAAGNADPTPASRAFTVDTTPPDTTGPDTKIGKRPKAKIKTKKKKIRVKVAFSSEPGATFKCRLDKAKFKPCKSPYRVKVKAKAGKGEKHSISVRATDASGNIGKTAKVAFRVVRSPLLRAPVARRTVAVALQRHGFARRVVKALRVNCKRRNRSAFACDFTARFPGYELRGSGKVELRGGLSYRLKVKAQGLRFTLTDENESKSVSGGGR